MTRMPAVRPRAVVAVIAAAAVSLVATGSVGVAAAVVALSCGAGAASRRRRARQRQRAARQVPAALDLIAAGMVAGCDLIAAIENAARITDPPLDEILARVGRRIALGMSPPAALDAEAVRDDGADLARLARVVRMGWRQGSALAPGIRAVADDLRARDQAQRLATAGRGASLAAVVTAVVVAPACVAALASLVVGAMLLGGAASGR